MKKLKPGDPCPCCGKPIKTRDPERLEFLSLMAEWLERHPELEEARSCG